ncbi:MAG: extracellular solute-binding protein, partial [Bacteroidota bacterium]
MSCTEQEEFPARDNTKEVAEFYVHYNEQVKAKIERDIEEIEKILAGSELKDEERAEKQQALSKLRERRKNPEYFSFKTIDDLPKNLNWETNWDEPELGSDRAKKGGVFHYYFENGLAFPPTIRTIGPNSNNGFRGEHYDNVEMGLIGIHPNTGAMIPSLADRWSVSEDKKTVYFHVDEKATFSDGMPVEVDDFFMGFYLYLGPYISAPYSKDYFETQFQNITRYDAKTLSVTLTKPKPMTPYFAAVSPVPRHFYKEVGPDFDERYNWRPRPTTGAYVIRKEDISKGRSISLTRVRDWWARDRKYTKNSCNVDKVVYRLIRDSDKALEYFKRGKLDFFPLTGRVNGPKDWYEKTEFDAVFNGYIEKVTFYNDYPAIPRGLYINCSRPILDNVDVRVGLQYATNFDKVIEFEFRGDAARCETFADGYGRYSHPSIRARRFSIEKAAECFARAGFTKRGDDGVLINDKGQRLSFTITTPNLAFRMAMLSRVKEEAIKAGVEYKIESLDGSDAFLKGLEKKHEIIFSGWGSGPPFPSYKQFYHSSNAFDKDSGDLKLMTNNFSVYSDSEMDVVSERIRQATDLDEIEKYSHRAEEIIHRDAPWIPAFHVPLLRCAYWRWMRWPDDFSVKMTRDLYASSLYWIDEDIKKETEKAMRDGDTFPEK